MHLANESKSTGAFARTSRRAIVVAVLGLVGALLPLAPTVAGAQTTEGSLYAFGSGESPALVGGLGTGLADRIVEVDGGDGHYVALTVDGRVFTWGNSVLGQSGRLTQVGPFATNVDPGQVAGLSPVVDIAAGADHTLALTSSGHVYAWGANTAGQLGQTESLLFSPTPIQVPGLTGIASIAAGGNHSLAVTQSGSLYAWGLNSEGQAGTTGLIGEDGVDLDELGSPVIVTTPTPVPVGSVVEAAAGERHTVVRLQDGTVKGFGSNLNGQLGDRVGWLPFQAVKLGVDDAAEIDATDAGTIIRRANGEIVVFGAGSTLEPQVVALSSDLQASLTAMPVSSVDTCDSRPGPSDSDAIEQWRNCQLVAAGGTQVLVRTPSAASTNVHTFDVSPGTDPVSDQVVMAADGEILDAVVAIGAGAERAFIVEAPRVSVEPTSLDFEEAFGPLAVFNETGTLTVTVTNDGPGAVSVAPDAISSDHFFATGDTCTGGTILDGDTCDIEVTFAPKLIDELTETLAIDHDAYGDPLTVVLRGVGEQEGEIIVRTDSDLSVGVPASPRQIDIDAIPVQPLSPQAADEEGTGLPLIDQIGIGLPLIDQIGIGLPLIDQIGIGLPLIDQIGIGLPLIDQIGIGLPLIDQIGISPAAMEVLDSIPVSSIPLQAPFRWDDPELLDPQDPDNQIDLTNGYPEDGWAVLATSEKLHGKPLQTISLADVIRDDKAENLARDRWGQLPLWAVQWHDTKLASVSGAAFLIGNVTFGEIGDAEYGFCQTLADQGDDTCGAEYGEEGGDILSTTPFEAELAGLPLGTFDLGAVRLEDLPQSKSVVGKLALAKFPLYASNLGSVKLSEVEDRSAVTGCASCETLYAARDDLLVTAQVSDLSPAADSFTIASILYGMQPAATLPFGALSLQELLVRLYEAPEATNDVGFTVEVTAETTIAAGSAVTVQLPENFGFIPRSVFASVDDGGSVALESTGDVDRAGFVRWTLPESITPVNEGEVLEIDFSVHPGTTLGLFSIEEVAIERPDGTVASTAPGPGAVWVRDPEYFENYPGPTLRADADGDGLPDGNDTVAGAEPIDVSLIDGVDSVSGSMEIGYIGRRDDVDLYSFPASAAPAGSRIRLDVQHQLSGDVDVLLYAPATPQTKALRPPEDREPLTYGEDLLTSADGSSSSLASDAILRERSIIPGDYEVLALSQERDANDELAIAVAPEGVTGNYIVAVVPYNGNFGPDAYSLRVTVIPPVEIGEITDRAPLDPIDQVALAVGDPVIAGNPTTAETIFLTAPSRMKNDDDPTVDLLGRLTDPALSSVIGSSAVIALDRVPEIAFEYAEMDEYVEDVGQVNDVVRAANAYVDSFENENLQYLVIVGGDDVVPMARIPDLTVTVAERYYTGQARALAASGSPNALLAATANNTFLSDAPFGDLAPTPVIGKQFLYVEDIPVGRLVETEAEITALLGQFIAYDGDLDPTTAEALASADFLDDGAEAVAAALDEILGEGATRRSIADEDWGPDGLARADAAVEERDIVALNGHANPFGIEVGGETVAAYDAGRLASSAVSPNAILISVGCHWALPVSDSIVRSGLGPEFSQAASQAGIQSLQGNTGYGIGSRSTVGYSERLQTEFIRMIPGRDQGNALIAAKRAYLASQGHLDTADLKVAQEMAHFGMPHLQLQGVLASEQPGPLSTTTQGAVDVAVDLFPQYVETEDGGYFTTDPGDPSSGTISAPNQPIVPAATSLVSPVGTEVVGFMLDSAESFEAASNDAASEFFDPVLETLGLTAPGQIPAPPEWNPADANFPANLYAGIGNRLRLATGLFRSVGLNEEGNTIGTMTVFTKMRGRAFVRPVGAPRVQAPEILWAQSLADDGLVMFTMEAHDSAGIAEASVVFRERVGASVSGQWRSVPLIERDPVGHPGIYSASAVLLSDPDAEVESMYQARNVFNIVTHLNNKARLVPSVELTPGPFGPVSMTVDGQPAATNPSGDLDGWWVSASVELHNDSNQLVFMTATVNDGAPFIPTANSPQLQDLPDGDNRINVYVGGQLVGQFIVKVDSGVPAPIITNPSSSNVLLNDPSAVGFVCPPDAVSGLASCEAVAHLPDGTSMPIANGDPVPASSTGSYAIAVTATDRAGNDVTTSLSYTVGYALAGFFQPVIGLDTSDPTYNTPKAGRTVPYKFQVSDALGNQITRTSVVIGWDSVEVACETDPSETELPDTTEAPEGLYHDGSQFHLDWATDPEWAETCRVFSMGFDDGQWLRAGHRFKP